MLSRIHVLVQMCRPQGKLMLIHHALKSYYSSVSRSQLCLTLCDPMDCSPPGSSVHGIFPARILEWPVPSPGDLPDSGIEPPGLLHCRQILYRLSQQGSPRIPLKFSTLSLSAHSRCEGGRSIFGSPPMAHPDLWLNPIPSLVAMETGWKKDAGLLLCVWGDVWQYLGACTMPTLGAKR